MFERNNHDCFLFFGREVILGLQRRALAPIWECRSVDKGNLKTMSNSKSYKFFPQTNIPGYAGLPGPLLPSHQPLIPSLSASAHPLDLPPGTIRASVVGLDCQQGSSFETAHPHTECRISQSQYRPGKTTSLRSQLPSRSALLRECLRSTHSFTHSCNQALQPPEPCSISRSGPLTLRLSSQCAHASTAGDRTAWM